MEKYPEIYQSLFGDSENAEFTRRDSCINSDLIRCACDFLNVVYDELNGFTSGTSWNALIEDEHDDEVTPHYVLEIGEQLKKIKATNRGWTTIEVRYCDNYSMPDRIIQQNPGSYMVKVCIIDDPVRSKVLAEKLCEAYEESLRKHFPDYYIICRKVVE